MSLSKKSLVLLLWSRVKHIQADAWKKKDNMWKRNQEAPEAIVWLVEGPPENWAPALILPPAKHVLGKSHQLSEFPGLKKKMISFTDTRTHSSQALIHSPDVCSDQDWAEAGSQQLCAGFLHGWQKLNCMGHHHCLSRACMSRKLESWIGPQESNHGFP